MERSVKFYSTVLGFEKTADHEYTGDAYENLEGLFGLNMHVVTMQLGDESIELVDYLTAGGKPIPVDSRANDLWFQHIAIVVSDMDKAFAHLRKFNVEYVSALPQTIPASNPAAAGIRAFYFHDPDNHNLELIYFPPGKGNPKWQTAGGKLFRGIDHTAIAVSNTANSLKFYRDALGLGLKGESFNYGIEQSRLNNVENDSLHISGLRAPEGFGVEFLEYLKPGPGRTYSSVRADDLVAWQTAVQVNDVNAVYAKLKAAGYEMVSRRVVTFAGDGLPKRQAFVVRDPDGHLVMVSGNAIASASDSQSN
jgi:catechol 2,3-dioxygenase-like lactoylglutathione lyase family enzyme